MPKPPSTPSAKKLRAPQYNLSSPMVSQQTRWNAWDAIETMPFKGSTGSSDYGDRMIDAVSAVARAWNGECLSTTFAGHRSPLQFVCSRKHRFDLLLQYVRRGAWCPECALARFLDEQQHIPARRNPRANGIYLSKEFRGSQAPLVWRCVHGHEWADFREDGVRGKGCLCTQ
jgi:hypothetical protein